MHDPPSRLTKNSAVVARTCDRQLATRQPGCPPDLLEGMGATARSAAVLAAMSRAVWPTKLLYPELWTRTVKPRQSLIACLPLWPSTLAGSVCLQQQTQSHPASPAVCQCDE